MATLRAVDANAPDPDLRPWDRQPGETAIQYSWFTAYRTLPVEDRTFRAAWLSTAKSDGERERWARQPSAPGRWFIAARDNQWRRRALAWDAFTTAENDRKYTRDRDNARRARRRMLARMASAFDRRINAMGQPPVVVTLRKQGAAKEEPGEPTEATMRMYPGVSIDDAALLPAARAFMEEWRREYNDLPEERRRDAVAPAMTASDSATSRLFDDDDIPDDDAELDAILARTRSVRAADVG